MTQDEPIWLAVHAAIDELNEGLPAESRVDKSPETILFGSRGKLGSLHTLNLIYLVEQKVHERLQTEVSLAETLVSQDGSELPESLQQFVDRVSKLVAA